MREILFRGKRKTDNKWLYGFPYVTRKNAVKINWYCSDFGSMRTDEVNPETVGQYTGVTDKNSTKIFEGDIIESVSRLVNSVGTPTGGTSRYCEVIGNIYDNSELLEDGEEDD